LDKRVPHGAGLGGGSADAAAVLAAGAQLLSSFGRPVDPGALHAAALAVGSDVPALLAGSACRVGGRGEQIERLSLRALDLVVVSTVPSSTADTYAAVTSAEMVSDGRIGRLIDALSNDRMVQDELFGSALEAAAIRASGDVGAAAAHLRATTPGTTWHLTGSGGALFTLTDGPQQAQRLGARLQEAGFAARACRTLASMG
jgi:4-diphosphocytidyl-2-C-methyl-D-erythritol kinase